MNRKRDEANAETADTAAAEWVALADLRPWMRNPRKNDAAVAKIIASIQRFGFGAPILARRSTGEIIAGHTRLAAAKVLGIKRVPVRYLDLSEKDAHALALADNKLGEVSQWDENALAEILAEFDQADLDIAGFAKQEEIDEPELPVERVDTAPLENERFWFAVEGPLPAQPDALMALRRALEALPGVVVSFVGGEPEKEDE